MPRYVIVLFSSSQQWFFGYWWANRNYLYVNIAELDGAPMLPNNRYTSYDEKQKIGEKQSAWLLKEYSRVTWPRKWLVLGEHIYAVLYGIRAVNL